MAQLGNVQEIIKVKDHLEQLKSKNLIVEWELPYENILTRLTAAIFFVKLKDNSQANNVWTELSNAYPMFTCRENEEKKLSALDWRVEFNKGYEA